MSVQTAYDLSLVWYEDRMSEAWEPFEPADAEAIFAGVGLTGEFWRLT